MQCRRNEKTAHGPDQDAAVAQESFREDEEQARASPREALSPTERFPVVLPSQPSVVESMADLEAMIEDLVDDQDNGAPNNAKKRRLLPGADTHSRRFQDMFRRSHTILSDSLDNIAPDISPRTNTILRNTRRMLGDLRAEYPDISEDIRGMMLVAAHLAEGHLVVKPVVTDCAALTWMVEGDRHMRVHKGFLYIYDDDGCFLPFGGIPPEAVLHRVHRFFVSLEGIFRRMKPEITRKANYVARSSAADMQNHEAEAEYLEACRDATTKPPLPILDLA